MLKIGLTGGIGSGKSTVARVFAGLGVPVYRADNEAKSLMVNDPVLREKIIYLLGKDAYKNGDLNNGFIAFRVFNDNILLEKLNKIVHPAVREDFENWSEAKKENSYIIEEAAILFETGSYTNFDYNILVFARDELRIKRIMHRDGADREDILKRIARQMDQDSKVKLSDFIIYNNEKDLILPQVLNLHDKFISLHQ